MGGPCWQLVSPTIVGSRYSTGYQTRTVIAGKEAAVIALEYVPVYMAGVVFVCTTFIKEDA